MTHVHDMDHAAHVLAPAWLPYSLAILFLIGAGFYLYRFLRPAAVKSVYGWFDSAGEIGHGVGMLAMAAMLIPNWLLLSGRLWTVALISVGGWFLLRALTWGRRLTYSKWWWDWAHVGMLFSMALMFSPVGGGILLVVLQQSFWLWFAGYYLYELYHDLKQPKALYIGSDLSHLSMGLVMFVMVTWPMALMPMAV